MSIFFIEIVDYLNELSFFFSCFFFIRILLMRRTLFEKYLDRIGHLKRMVRVESWENIFFLKKGWVFNAMALKQETACFLRLKYNTID